MTLAITIHNVQMALKLVRTKMGTLLALECVFGKGLLCMQTL